MQGLIQSLPDHLSNKIFYYLRSPDAEVFDNYKQIVIKNNAIKDTQLFYDYDRWAYSPRRRENWRRFMGVTSGPFINYRDETYRLFRFSRTIQRRKST